MGLMWRWFEIFLSNKTELMNYYFQRGADKEPFKPLTLTDFSGAFCILAFGLTLSSIAFVLELLIHSITKDKKSAGELKPDKKSICSEDPPFPFTL